MPSLYRLDASIRDNGSITRRVADNFEATLTDNLRDASIIRREIGLTPLPSTAWAGAVFGPHAPVEQRTPEQTQGMAIAAELADELIAADAYVFALPFYNFGVSQHFKTYVDIVLADRRFAPGKTPVIAGRPAQLIIARGGGWSRYSSPRLGSWLLLVPPRAGRHLAS